MFSDDVKQRVRDATDLAALVGETVELRPRGADLWACCPFHHEKSPSFHVIPARGLWHCFGCGKGGDCFDFVMERDHVSFPEAVRLLADRAGIDLPEDDWHGQRAPRSRRQRLFEAMDAAVDFYHLQLTRVRSQGADRARAYLAGRGFGLAVSDRWDLGYAPGGGALCQELLGRGFSRQELLDAQLAAARPDGSLRDAFYDRVIFPIRDERGQAVALGGRIMGPKREGVPKYINSRDSAIYSKRKTMFALDRAKAHITAQSEAIIEEGYTDVISSHEAGIQNATAACGTSLTPEHVRLIDRFLHAGSQGGSRGRIICMFDGDEAGLKAAERALGYVSLTSAPLYCVVLPGGQDPAEFLEAEGADALRELLRDPEPLARFVIDRHLERFDASTPEGRAAAVADVAQAMAPLKGTSLADDYVEYVAGRLLVDASTVRGALAQVRKVEPRVEAEAPAVVEPDGRAREGSADPEARPARASSEARAALLPEDARALRVEREVLSTIAANVGAAQAFSERISQVTWVDPRHESMAWAMLALPADATPLDALGAAESVEPDAASILSAGTLALSDEADDARALSILLDDLEIRSLRRRIASGRARLHAGDAASDRDAYNATFAEVVEMQGRLRELERRQRSTK